MRFLVAGDANADVSAALHRFPHEGDDSPIRDLGWGSGGSAVNVAAALARLGARVRLLARVGGDPAAEVALRAAAAAGVDLGAVQRDAARPTGLCFAAVSPGGERTFFSHRGANTDLALPDVASLLDGVEIVHVAGHALLEGRQRATALALIDEASRRGLRVTLDLCLPLLRAAPAEVIDLAPRLAVIFANEMELASLAGSPEAALSLLEARGAALIAAKLGARGSVIAGRGRDRLQVPAFPVEACDATGAGDAYVGGFLLAFSAGAPPEVAGRLGNALGALTATRPGAADALPHRAEVGAFLEAHEAAREIEVLSPARRV